MSDKSYDKSKLDKSPKALLARMVARAKDNELCGVCGHKRLYHGRMLESCTRCGPKGMWHAFTVKQEGVM